MSGSPAPMPNPSHSVEPSLLLPDLVQTAELAAHAAHLELVIGRHNIQTVSGEGDTGTITLTADLALHQFLSDLVIGQGWTGSYTEEGAEADLVLPTHVRMNERHSCSIDPLDGTGDYRYGQPGTPSGDGYSTLLSYTVDGQIKAGICIRTAHRQVFIFDEAGIHLYDMTVDGSTAEDLNISLTPTTYTPPNRKGLLNIKINYRPAYSGQDNQTNFPDEFLTHLNDVASGQCTFEFEYADAGGAGDALSRLILGDLDMVVSGMKTDWKFWDTALFALPIAQLGGRFSNYLGQQLHEETHARTTDLWHTNGVLASIGSPIAHAVFVEAMRTYRKGFPNIFRDPRED